MKVDFDRRRDRERFNRSAAEERLVGVSAYAVLGVEVTVDLDLRSDKPCRNACSRGGSSFVGAVG